MPDEKDLDDPFAAYDFPFISFFDDSAQIREKRVKPIEHIEHIPISDDFMKALLEGSLKKYDEVKPTPKPQRKPLTGYGDPIEVGDLVEVTLQEKDKAPEIDPVVYKVIDYVEEPHPLVSLRNEWDKESLVECSGEGWKRTFKKV